METTQCHSSARQHLRAQQGIKHKCGWASASQVQTKVWHLNYAVPQLGMHFDRHVSQGHKPFSNFLDDPVFWRNCSPMPLATQPSLLLNVPPFTSSTCNMHFIMAIVFTCCTALMLAGIFLGGFGLVLSVSSTFQLPHWYNSRRNIGLFQKHISESSKTRPQGGLNFSLAVARASWRGTGKAKYDIKRTSNHSKITTYFCILRGCLETQQYI